MDLDIENRDESLLFKFYPININLSRSLVNSEIWFSALNKLNDPFEVQFEMERMDELPTDEFLFDWYQTRSSFKHSVHKTKRLIESIKRNPSQFYKDLKTDLKICYFNKLKVACFSLIYNEILMWSHYADEHKGICLVFNKVILNGDDSYKKSHLEVDFVKAKKVLYGFPEKLRVSFKKEEFKLPIKNLEGSIFKKLKCWKYEKEYRILYKDTFSTIANGINLNFNKKALRGIIFGEKWLNADISLIHSILTKSGYVDSDFVWGASRIVPTSGKLVTTSKKGIIDLYEITYDRNKWLFQPFN